MERNGGDIIVRDAGVWGGKERGEKRKGLAHEGDGKHASGG